MSAAIAERTAMILPVPVKSQIDTALQFVDLSSHHDFFENLAALFDPPIDSLDGLSVPMNKPMLAVERVGDFDASFVPSREHFGRLDPRFRLSDDVWSKLPKYDGYGFAVFILRDVGNIDAHPMAFWFETQSDTDIFFPTVHFHGHGVPKIATFDHSLYYQGPQSHAAEWEAQIESTSEYSRTHLDRDGAVSALVTRTGSVYRRVIDGDYPNHDIRVSR